MLLYRITKSKYAKDLTGDGARRAGGRWNIKGVPVIYTSDSTALATLEAIVHVPLNIIPAGMAISYLELPDGLPVEILKKSDLPKNWHTYPAPLKLAKIGSDWASKGRTVAIRVPSSVTPSGEGCNYLLNPRHPDFHKISIVKTVPYKFNGRLFSGQNK